MGHRSNGFKPITTAVLTGAAGISATMLVGAAMLAGAPREAAAMPAYAQQTGRACGVCHVNPAGGGKLKPAGAKFQAKGHKL